MLLPFDPKDDEKEASFDLSAAAAAAAAAGFGADAGGAAAADASDDESSSGSDVPQDAEMGDGATSGNEWDSELAPAAAAAAQPGAAAEPAGAQQAAVAPPASPVATPPDGCDCCASGAAQMFSCDHCDGCFCAACRRVINCPECSSQLCAPCVTDRQPPGAKPCCRTHLQVGNTGGGRQLQTISTTRIRLNLPTNLRARLQAHVESHPAADCLFPAEQMAALTRIVEETGATIVLSSTWRSRADWVAQVLVVPVKLVCTGLYQTGLYQTDCTHQPTQSATKNLASAT